MKNIRTCCWLLLVEICAYTKTIEGFPCYFAKDECPNDDVQFWYYKKDFPNSPYLLDPLNISRELFEPQRPIEILIHGLSLNKDKTPNMEMRPLLLEHINVDVISVDYEPMAALPCYYPWAVQNARVVGKCLAQLLNVFHDQGIYTPQMIHIIGFSLGAQIAGLAANDLNFKVNRITGLDPAGWFFSTSNVRNKLDASDASFVDIIHTDVYLFSDINPMGHADFYPNLGPIRQPGCSFEEESRNCNHFRSAVYYAESIVTQSYDNDHQLMGYFVSNR
uniref:Lipase domain-containing protein n=1 Tax=Stomoxys calcitrans TaxID=35570 RepID=A0A1I8PL45_STOCA